MVVDKLSETLLALRYASKSYGRHKVLSDVSFQIKRGETIIVRGSNGSGKSTLLRIVCGIVPVSSGERVVQSTKLLLGYAPDRLPKLRMTSTQYLMHMGRISQMPKQQLQTRIADLHAFYRLEQSSIHMTHYSKGMLQKVNMMQATLVTPDLLVLDEPFSGLDSESVEHLLDSLKQLKSRGTSIMAAVHDPFLATQLESRTYWIYQGELREEIEKASSIFELVCEIEEDMLNRLLDTYPQISYQWKDKGHVSISFNQLDYNRLMQTMLTNGIEIISLQRKELRA